MSSIHYNGKLENRARLAELLDAARLYCIEQRWMYRDIDESIVGQVECVLEADADASQAQDASGEPATQLVPIDDTLHGILITVNPKAEPVWLTFNNAGELARYIPLDDAGTFWEIKSLSTGVQAAGIRTHIALCDLFHLIKDEYFPGLNVYDEANYFESGDVSRAANAVELAEPAFDPAEAEHPDLAADVKYKRKKPNPSST